MSGIKYRKDIDGLRAFSVLVVILFHAFPNFLTGGFVGVDVFFVISGFLITGIIFKEFDENQFSFAGFFSRRIRRIFPALAAVLLSCFVAGWFLLLSDELAALGRHIFAGSAFISNILLWMEAGYFDKVAETKPLLHLWSLGVEEQFYILWPVILWAAWKTRANIFLLTLSVAILSFCLNLWMIKDFPEATFYWPITRFWEMLSGSMMAWILRYKSAEFEKCINFIDTIFSKLGLNIANISINLLSIMGLSLLLLSAIFFHKDIGFPGHMAVFPILGAIMILAAGPQAFVNQYILSNPMAVAVGLISYPLYLWHWPILSFMHIIDGDVPPFYVMVSGVILSFILSWLTYQFIEKPIRFGMNSKKAVGLLTIFMAILAIAGMLTARFDGVPHRASISAYDVDLGEMVRTNVVDNDCLSYIGVKEAPFYYCRYNDVGGDETIALIGDSHAHAAYPGIAEGLAKQGKNTLLLANSGCPILVGFDAGTNRRERKKCGQSKKFILDKIIGDKRITAVLFSSRGSTYILGYEPADKRQVKDRARPAMTGEQFRAASQKPIDILYAKGKKIYYITENPELHVQSDYCIKRPLRPERTACSLNYNEVAKRQQIYIKAVSQLKNVIILDSLQAFCPNKQSCKIFDNNILLYADDDHLSVTGSHYQYEKLIAPALTAP
ncbi:hypothetical protein LPB140_02430 [Sphingorhabdus lutea]|uniref:Acyltransferase n=1 Tax=Sphingorhabdus lutea TaxID=1913578 RepID=A0A1L3J9S2_9SPHN|nr:acyltransferase family protein [Sphingorhabdus lutea]APG61869.1 hypothetical protein LPB140_02430 [Sphingorhabdus lutea]